MLVTEPDLMIAQYAIQSFRLLQKAGFSFKLIIYGNCLSAESRGKWYPLWQKFPYVSIQDNSELYPYPRALIGRHITTPEGLSRRMEGPYELGATIWHREIQQKVHRFSSPFVATVDADFEILSTDFISEAISRFKNNSRLGGISTGMNPDIRNFQNKYHQCRHFLHRRLHTCFCIYRKECLNPDVSCHEYTYRDENGQLKVFDDWGRVQDENIKRGWKFEAIGDKFPRSWIHYNAFSKNKRINFQNVVRYHRYRVWMRRGLIPSLGFDGARGRLNRWWGYGIHELFVREFGGADKAREGSGEFEPWIAVRQRKGGNNAFGIS